MTAEHRSPTPRGALRASHADRDQVVERLRDAAAEGRLDLDELEARLEKALTAKTFADLDPLTADLPGGSPTSDEPLVLKGGMHGATRVGRWQVPSRIRVDGGLGGVKLDFTRTDCRLPVIEIEADGKMAGVTLVVPFGWGADISGVDPGMGGVKDKTTDHPHAPGSPLLRLTGTGGMGGITIRHPGPVERRRLKRT